MLVFDVDGCLIYDGLVEVLGFGCVMIDLLVEGVKGVC